MPKSVSAGMVAHLGLSSTTLAMCFKLKRQDGIIFGFTEHDKDLTVDIGDGDGEVVYEASSGYNRTEISNSNKLTVDELEIEGFLSSDVLVAADLRAGKYSHAEVRIFLVDWSNVADGVIHQRRGWLGEVHWTEDLFYAELRGLVQAYSQEIIELSTADCRADFGDTRCKIQLQPPAWYANMDAAAIGTRDKRADETGGSPTVYNIVQPTTENGFYYHCTTGGQAGASEPSWPTTIGGTVVDGGITWGAIRAHQQTGEVTTATSQFEVVASGINDVSGYSPTEQFWGHLEWLTGDNVGIIQEITDDDGGGNLTFFQAAPFTIQVGDTFRVTALCRKTRSACKSFGNLYNMRAEPDVPGNDQIFDYPING
jgi:hypothetical protein